MGSGVSRLAGCFIGPRDAGSGGVGLQFSEPLDEGLGHSFCYVRPHPSGSPCLISPEKSDEFPASFGKNLAGGDVKANGCGGNLSAAQKDESILSRFDKSKGAVESLGIPSGTPTSESTDMPTNGSKAYFVSISGASVSANTATPRSIPSCEQFNSFSNVLFDRPAAFASTSSFSHLPLQPVPRGFSGHFSGPMDRGLASGPLERGFMSGPLERGFMSGPLERGFLSGPLDPTERPHFSAPLHGPYRYSNGYFRKRKKSFARLMRSMSGPMKKALVRTASSLAKTQRSLVAPVKSFVFKDSKEIKDVVGKPSLKLDESPENVCTSSDLDLSESDNLQWAQGKAGEDRVHVVISEDHGWLFVGIYDGFSGPDAPDFLMSNMYPAVSQELKDFLWDTKDDSDSSGEGECEWEVVGDRQADGGETASKQIEDWKKESSRLRNGGRRRGALVKLGHHRSLSKKGFLRTGESTNRSSASQYLGRRREFENSQPCERACSSDPVSSLCLACSEDTRGTLRTAMNLLVERPGQDQESRLPLSELERRGFAPEPDGVLANSENLGEVFSREQESTSQSNPLEVDGRLNRKKPVVAFRLRHNQERRKEQLRKYFKWRYKWGQGNQSSVHKVQNAKVGQEPDGDADVKTADHAEVLSALARALQSTEDAYLNMADNALFENPELALMGSCVLVMVMKGSDVYILNVGDSRAVLARHPEPETSLGDACKNGSSGSRDSLGRVELERIIEESPMDFESGESTSESRRANKTSPCCGGTLSGALQLTVDHSTNIEEEVLRLKSEHADEDTIHNDRVKGRLKVTRAFGAGFLKQPKWNDALLEMFRIDFIGTAPYITCTPALYHHKLGPKDQFLVLSSDGLYQYLSNEEVVSHVERFMDKSPDGDPAQHLIELLLFRAAEKAGMAFHELLEIPQGDRRRFHDDVSVIVISFEGRVWRSAS